MIYGGEGLAGIANLLFFLAFFEGLVGLDSVFFEPEAKVLQAILETLLFVIFFYFFLSAFGWTD